MDDMPARSPGNPLAALVREDIDRLSVDELTARIAALEAEIARCRTKIDHAVNHRASVESLFRR